MDGELPGTAIRIWVPGCSTGEEVYSLAIILLEYLEDQTELSDQDPGDRPQRSGPGKGPAAGVYLDNIEIDVSPTRLRRFFVRQDGHYQISKSVRELCIFSRHNVVQDPPFSRLDLISCRNVLIYMDAALQKRVIPRLHYALNPNGFLFLGSSENVNGHRALRRG